MSLEKIKLTDIYDVAILQHGFAKYGRDYNFIIETNWSNKRAGQYLLTFRHCYSFDYNINLDSKILNESWSDIFTDHDQWEKEGEPEGFVWGTNWSLAYPGFKLIENSQRAEEWTGRLNKK